MKHKKFYCITVTTLYVQIPQRKPRFRIYIASAQDCFSEEFISLWVVKLLSHLQNNDTLD